MLQFGSLPRNGTLDSSSFLGNRTSLYGGAVFLRGWLATISNCKFENGIVTEGAASLRAGGALSADFMTKGPDIPNSQLVGKPNIASFKQFSYWLWEGLFVNSKNPLVVENSVSMLIVHLQVRPYSL